MEEVIIKQKIFIVRNKQVMLDFHLAEMYSVETRVLNQAVKRNIERFPGDFMLSLTREEIENLSQFVIGSQIKHTSTMYAFTEQGVAMLSGVLRSPKAIEINIQIMRLFVKVRELALTNRDLFDKIKEIEARYDGQFDEIYNALNRLIEKKSEPRKAIGYKTVADGVK